MTIKRYNAGIQRAKGLLEIAAGLYDTSLSHETRHAAEGVLQTDARVGRGFAPFARRKSCGTQCASGAASSIVCRRPSDPGRRAAIEKRTINAICDEGIKSWGQTAIDNGFCFLRIEGTVLKKLRALGYRPTEMSPYDFQNTTNEIQTIDFSGWPMIVHTDMADEVVYAFCEANRQSQNANPYRQFQTAKRQTALRQ